MGRYVPWRTSNYSEDTEIFSSEEIRDMMHDKRYTTEETYAFIKNRGYKFQYEDFTPSLYTYEAWCTENLSMNYTLVDGHIFFQDESDMMAFKLKFL